jgi:lambda family phage holin
MSGGGSPFVIQVVWDMLPEPFKAAVLATLIAVLRVVYDGKEPRFLRRAMEACLCGAIAFGLATGLEAMEVPSGMATFIGGAIGLLGADKVREFAQRYVTAKVEKESK